MPASTMKIVTLAAAARKLGWDDRFETKLYANGPLIEGTLNGDLLVQGSGDPTIESRKFFRDWAEQLQKVGVHTITGRLIGDDSVVIAKDKSASVNSPGFGFGWSWDDLTFGFAAPIGPLQFKRNVVELVVEPGAQQGDPTNAFFQLPGSSLTIIENSRTGAPGEATQVRLRQTEKRAELVLDGRIATDANAMVIQTTVYNPTTFFMETLKDVFAKSGIDVRGPAIDIDTLATTERISVQQNLSKLFEHHSEPLSTSAIVMMKQSQNLYAESVFQRIGLMANDANPSGANAIKAMLDNWGIDQTHSLIVDGSGLSRYNYLTANALTSVLTINSSDPSNHEQVVATLPIAALDGTLRNRMRGTPAASRVHAKTGSMSQVRSLAGYATTTSGEVFAFAFIANNFGGYGKDVNTAIDDAIVTITEFQRH